MAYLQWSEGEVRASCPLCGVEGAKGAVLATDHVLPGHPRITLLRCPACGVAFLEDLTPPGLRDLPGRACSTTTSSRAPASTCIVAPLLRLPPGSVRRCLDIGCSFGFALDFGRHAFGWEVLGVDPSPLAAAGAEALGLPIRRRYFSADLDLGPEPFDLALCSEILEHLAEPLPLLARVRERLSPEGLLVLSTPNLALVRPGDRGGGARPRPQPGVPPDALRPRRARPRARQGRLLRGPHRGVAGDAPRLRRLLAGGARPHAADESEEPAPERTLLRDYFGARAAAAPTASALACGFAWRHFKECVNAGLYEEAAASRAVLARIYQARFGLDLDRPEEVAAWLRRRPRPFNLTGALFFSGILELNGRAPLAPWLRSLQSRRGLFRGGPRGRRSPARRAAPVRPLRRRDGGVRGSEPQAPADGARRHRSRPGGARDRNARRPTPRIGLPRAARRDACAQTFVRLVNAGAYAAAERLAPQVRRQIEARDEADPEALDPLYGLAMLALQTNRPGEAADLFGRVHDRIEQIGRSGGPERADLLRSARDHQDLSLRQVGREAPARTLRAQVAAALRPLARAARALLSPLRAKKGPLRSGLRRRPPAAAAAGS